jgi:hypothetical protein
MCRNIKSLYNFDPPATEEEIQAAALQFVRKISGFQEPSKINKDTFNRGLFEIAKASKQLLESLVTQAPARNRELEIAKARLRTTQRFGVKV